MSKRRTIQAIYYRQKQRCNNPDHPDYKWWGAKGIKVEYTSKQFVQWYEKAIQEYTGDFPSVGRINHKKKYSLDNIEIQSMSDNAKERIQRKGNPNPGIKINIFDSNTMNLISVADSAHEASRITGMSYPGILCQCRNNKSIPRKQYIFRFAQ